MTLACKPIDPFAGSWAFGVPPVTNQSVCSERGGRGGHQHDATAATLKTPYRKLRYAFEGVGPRCPWYFEPSFDEP